MTSTTAASTVRPQRAVTAGKAAHSGARPTLVRRGAVNLVLLLIASCYLVPLLWLVLAAFNSTAGPAVTWPDRWRP